VVEFSATGTFADDLTCVVVQIAPPPERVVREFPCDLACLGAVRDFVVEACAGLPEGALHPEAAGCFTLAVNEAASNVVRHACRSESEHVLRVEADVFDDRLEVMIRHRGQPFTPAPGQGAPPTGPQEGGLGLFIIRKFADEVDYNIDALGYAYTRLVKRLGPQP
jgi:anti-sigma regulatory factor (Ser/Thr protein kinase)